MIIDSVWQPHAKADGAMMVSFGIFFNTCSLLERKFSAGTQKVISGKAWQQTIIVSKPCMLDRVLHHQPCRCAATSFSI
jgi:hypothetical protein